MVTAVAARAVVSDEVLTVGWTAPRVEPLVTPRICRLAALLIGRTQVPPLSARVIVSVVVAPVPVAEQLLKPLPRMIVPGLGATKPAVKATVIVSPVRSEPDAELVKLAVQVARAFSASVVELTVAAAGVVAATMVTAVAARAVVSDEVLTVGWTAPRVEPLVTPRICRLAALLIGRTQVPPLSARVIVSVTPAPVPAAEQLLKPLPRMMVPGLGATKPAVKATVIVSPVRSEPDAELVKLAVQVARAEATSEVALTVAAVTEVAATMVTAVAARAVVSDEVLTV